MPTCNHRIAVRIVLVVHTDQLLTCTIHHNCDVADVPPFNPLDCEVEGVLVAAGNLSGTRGVAAVECGHTSDIRSKNRAVKTLSTLDCKRRTDCIGEVHLNRHKTLLIVLAGHADVLRKRSIVYLRVGYKHCVVFAGGFGNPSFILPSYDAALHGRSRMDIDGQRIIRQIALQRVIAQRVDGRIVIRLENSLCQCVIAFFGIGILAFYGIGLRTNNFHSEGFLRLVEVPVHIIVQIVDGPNGIAVTEVFVLILCAGKQRRRFIIIPILPTPSAVHRFVGKGIDHGHALDHFLCVRILELLTVTQRFDLRGAEALDRQVRFLDGVSHSDLIAGEADIIPFPPERFWLVQLQGNRIETGIDSAFVFHHGIEFVIRNVWILTRPVIDQRLKLRGQHPTGVHLDRIRYCNRVIQVRVVRLEGQIEVLQAGGIQHCIRVFPYQAAVQVTIALQS